MVAYPGNTPPTSLPTVHKLLHIGASLRAQVQHKVLLLPCKPLSPQGVHGPGAGQVGPPVEHLCQKGREGDHVYMCANPDLNNGHTDFRTNTSAI